jgi:hypothetical protein
LSEGEGSGGEGRGGRDACCRIASVVSFANMYLSSALFFWRSVRI